MQVAQIQAGKNDGIHFYDTKQTDALLHSIAGLKGVKRLGFEPTDVTDAGLHEVPKLADLTELVFLDVQVFDHQLEILQACPKLEKLLLKPREPLCFRIAKVLELPHLQELHLILRLDPASPDAQNEQQWVDSSIHELKEAKSLRELTFEGEAYESRKAALAELQKDLPDCKITLLSRHGSYGKPIPLIEQPQP